ncbi:NRAMP family divalent metal transporter [Mitsuokella multacida]|uniref:NRAMP family divalent metal transporter n=1 Tax=Mitsuokella multacida TaxID=52226 RepID=UPI0026E00F54|nr:hypothetical protein [Mitsuokella multacida]
MASAAVGGSHIVASTQAGAIYGWQLAIIIILVNLCKYPFFRFGVHYTLATNESLLEGYRKKGRVYLGVFFILNVFAAMVNTAAVSIICAAILKFIFMAIGVTFAISIPLASTLVIAITWGILILGQYRFLDSLSKGIMIALTISTVSAVIIAAIKGGTPMAPDFVTPDPWTLASLGFIVALMVWMPAPIEISALNSMWVVAKRRLNPVSFEDRIFDFNVGYIGTAILALVFLALGALVQYGTGEKVEAAGVAYIGQLIKMYAFAIGDWSKLLIAVIAFLCMFGTTLTVIDGYSRANNEALRLLMKKEHRSARNLNIWMTVTSLVGIVIIAGFMSDVATLLYFAMICSFVSTPFFALLNFSLVRSGTNKVTGGLFWLGVFGFLYLAGFSILFIVYEAGLLK